MDFKKATIDIEQFVLKAGRLALKKQKGIKTNFKDGQQAVTETDLEISKLALSELSAWLALDNHVLIDEESVKSTPREIFSSSEYQWVLDPIDGTAGYALGRKLWGISLALLKEGVPLLGAIYLPALDELLITKQEASLRVTSEGEEELSAKKLPVNSQVFVESYQGASRGWQDSYLDNQIWMNTPEAAIQDFWATLTNQAAAATMLPMFSIWDVAASVALARHTGHKVLSMKDSRQWQSFSENDFAHNWKLKECWLLVHPENHDVICKALKKQ